LTALALVLARQIIVARVPETTRSHKIEYTSRASVSRKNVFLVLWKIVTALKAPEVK
jgi:hypothetical protein